MKSAEYFKRLKRAEIVTDNLKNKLNLLQENIKEVRGTNFQKDVIQTSSILSSVEEITIRMIELEQSIAEEMLNKINLQDKALIDINKLTNDIYISILIKRYLLNWDWMRIADSLNYSVQHIFRLHQKALNEFDNIIE